MRFPAASAAVVLIFLPLVLPHAHYQDRIPNGRNVPGAAGIAGGAWHAVGHITPRPQEHPAYVLDGFPRNPFGEHFKEHGFEWTPELCRLDSDDDGLTNGQELGDPQCVWRQGDEPYRSFNISHPGVSAANISAWAAKRRGDYESGRRSWRLGAISNLPFTAVLFYYQFIAIPLLLGSAVGASTFARNMPSWRKYGACRFPSLLGIFAVYYVLFIVGVGGGVHRYFSHKAYTATRPWKLFLAWLSLFVGQGGPLDWAYVHRLHHRLCEHTLDYHSPFNADPIGHNTGPLGLKGFVYAHATWLITPHEHVRRTPTLEAHLTPDIVFDPDLKWFNNWVNKNGLFAKGVIGWIAPGIWFGCVYFLACLISHCRARRRCPGSRRTMTMAFAPAPAVGEKGRAGVSSSSSAGGAAAIHNAPVGPLTISKLFMMVVSSYCFACYYFYLPVALTWMSTAFVNSATHLWGDAPFDDAMIARYARERARTRTAPQHGCMQAHYLISLSHSFVALCPLLFCAAAARTTTRSSSSRCSARTGTTTTTRRPVRSRRGSCGINWTLFT